jgi:hypothetical protein
MDHIQPCELTPVVFDGGANCAYLALDGLAIRPIKDSNPEAYREFHEWLTGEERDWLAGIAVEPPAC